MFTHSGFQVEYPNLTFGCGLCNVVITKDCKDEYEFTFC